MPEKPTTAQTPETLAKFPPNIAGLFAASATDKNEDVAKWDLALRFLEGKQWEQTRRFTGTSVLTTGSDDDDRIRPVVNFLPVIYRNMQARLSISYPSITVLPASGSSEDVMKSQASEIAVKYYWQTAKMKDVFAEMVEWALPCGDGAVHTFYDKEHEEIVSKAISPYDLFWEPGVRSWRESQWVAVRSFTTRQLLIDAYPGQADKIAATGASAVENAKEKRPEDRLDLYEVYWHDGRHALVVGNTYLFWETDAIVDPFPIQVATYFRVPKKSRGVGLIQLVMDLQWLYNLQRGQILENVFAMANPKWLIPKTCGITEGSITSKWGEKVFFNPAGGEPKQITAAALPGYALDSLARTQQEMYDVAGIHSTTLGKRAVGISSGKAMDILTENDTSQLQNTQASFERAAEAVAGLVLKLMQRHYTEAKHVRMLDDIGHVTFDTLDATNLVEDPEIFIQAGSLFRDEAQDRDAKTLQLLQLGLITPEEAKQELSFKTGGGFATKHLRAMARSREYLDTLIAGYGIEIFRNEDFEAVMEVFGDFMSTQDYYMLDQELQDTIRDTYLAVMVAKLPEAEREAAMQPVYPRPKAAPPADASIVAGAPPVPVPGPTAGDVLDQGAKLERGASFAMPGEASPAAGMGV